MKISIETINLSDQGDLFTHIEQQLRPVLLLLHGDVRALRLQLEDVNGPARGGVDKRCVIAVIAHAGGSRMFEDVHADARQALALTIGHLVRWAAKRELRKRAEPHVV